MKKTSFLAILLAALVVAAKSIGTYEEDFIFSDTFGCAGACSQKYRNI